MTLQQLKYVVTVAETGTITEAANRLYISQPSLTNAIRELEKEMKITIFLRTNKGIILSKEGEDFLGYARQVLEQAAILEDKYKGTSGGKKKFCVSTQHYSFAVNAFVDLIKIYGQDEYDFSLRETQTYEIIEDVAKMRSEIGILFLNNFNETVLEKILKSNGLIFHQLFVAKPHVFISRRHPLADHKIITNEELDDYPYLSFEQGEHNSFYFSEEIFSVSERKKNIRVRDRATLFNLLIGLNGYTVCSGVIDKKLNGKDIIAVPLADESDMRIGYITHKKRMLSRLGTTYLDALKICNKKLLEAVFLFPEVFVLKQTYNSMHNKCSSPCNHALKDHNTDRPFTTKFSFNRSNRCHTRCIQKTENQKCCCTGCIYHRCQCCC